MKVSTFPTVALALLALSLPACVQQPEHHEHVRHRVTATGPVTKDVTITQEYVCQIHSFRHIEVRALEEGFLEEIKVKEGQAVKQGDRLYQLLPILYQARLDSEKAEAHYAEMELANTEKLFADKVVSEKEVALLKAKLAKAQAKVKQAEAELNFTTLKAPFDGIVDHQYHQQGSLIEAGDILTTLSDNSLMWVYFNVPEARYLEYMDGAERKDEELVVELKLANGKKFTQVGKIGAIEADFNNQTGNIAFRADFPNPDHLLRHGQTGTVLLSRVLKDAIVIPQRATFEILAKQYVFVLEKDDGKSDGEPGEHSEHGDEHGHGGEPGTVHAAEIAQAAPAEHHDAPAAEHTGEHTGEAVAQHGDHAEGDHAGGEHAGGEHAKSANTLRGIVRQREIVVLRELDDIYVIKEGLSPDDKIILEGIRQVRDGEHVDYELVAPEAALENLKFHAE